MTCKKQVASEKGKKIPHSFNTFSAGGNNLHDGRRLEITAARSELMVSATISPEAVFQRILACFPLF